MSKCPFPHENMEPYKKRSPEDRATTNRDWWPDNLNIDLLRQHSELSDPMGASYNYKAAFENLDYFDLKKDIAAVLTNSQEWWPADFGNYGPFFIRMAWHSAGIYRTGDGRGGTRSGMHRFAPQNSWPDNVNLDKARRLLWPVKQKHGRNISWADLMILTGNVALEQMGFQTIGFAGGREDVWEPDNSIYYGKEKEWLADERYSGDRELEKPLAAVQMGLIYVNPEGPNGTPDPKLAAHDIRETFGRMGMNDEETVALIAGGHTLGKTHGAAPEDHKGPEPEAAPIEQQGIGWKSDFKSGSGPDAISSGLEVTWTTTPTQWSQQFFQILFDHEWELTKSPAGAFQWVAKNAEAIIPDAFDPDKKHLPTMLTTDLSLRFDPDYAVISKRFRENPEEFNKAFAKAWFKLTHRDMGPKSTYWGPEVPQEDFIWQDPIPSVDHKLVEDSDIETLKKTLSDSELSDAAMIKTAWASASTYRISDRRGGANGARIRLEPQISWESNNSEELKKVLKVYETIQADFNANNPQKKISIADLIVLAGSVGIENCLKDTDYDFKVPFTPGRTDATQDQTDAESFGYLEPMADGFRNYVGGRYRLSTEELLIDKAQQLTLTPPEMTVLVGGMRALNTNYNDSEYGILTDKPGVLTNDFFKNLLDMSTEWTALDPVQEAFVGKDRRTGETKWKATRNDLIFGSNSELRALAEVYASNDAEEQFIQDFIRAWVKVMELDRFDLK
ncbi:MAG: catalase/peroxidase HPI [Fluviicola sp.]